MKGRKHNKWLIRCQIFMKVLERKRRENLLLRSVARMK